MRDPYTAHRALDELDDNWGHLYDLWLYGAGFGAQRRGADPGDELDAATPEGLDMAIRADQELLGDRAALAAVADWERRGVDVLWIGFWQAIVGEDLGRPIVSRDGLPELLGRLAELDAAGMLPA